MIEETRSRPVKCIEPGALQLTTLDALIDEGTWAKQKHYIDIASCIYKEERGKRHLRHCGEAAGALAERQLVGPRASLCAPCG